jgi:hypothetical protein
LTSATPSPHTPAQAVFEINFSRWSQYATRTEGDRDESDGDVTRSIHDFLVNGAKKLIGNKRKRASAEGDALVRYGCVFYFDAKRNPLGFWWPEENRFVAPHSYTGDGAKDIEANADYNKVAFIFRSTLLTVATIQEHLIKIHWIVANSGTVNSQLNLNPEHPIRRFLKPHTYGTAAVNWTSTSMLAPVDGLAYRGFAFDKNSWYPMVTDCFKNFKFESIREHFDSAFANTETGLRPNDIPFYRDGFELWDIIETYTTQYINIFYKTDAELNGDNELIAFWNGYKSFFGNNKDIPGFGLGALTIPALIKLLCHHIFWVTGAHQYFGFICEYMAANYALAPKIFKGHEDGTDVQSYFQTLSLITLTNGPMPLMHSEDWFDTIWAPCQSNLIKDNLECIKTVFNDYQARLETQNSLILDRNQNARTQPFNAMQPSILDSSVSV